MSESGSNISLAIEDSNPKSSNSNKISDLHITHQNYESAEELVPFPQEWPRQKTHQHCKTERDDDFVWCFKVLKKGIRLACDSDYSPNCLIANFRVVVLCILVNSLFLCI